MLQINRLMRRRKEGGAALVEFAVLAPFLILLLLGIVEFGYKFGQYNELRHAVRETARYSAVSNPDRVTPSAQLTGFPPTLTDGSYDMLDKICTSLKLPTGTFTMTSTQTDNDTPANGIEEGDTARVSISANLPALSGVPLITTFVPTTLTASAEIRLEQPPNWTPVTAALVVCPVP